ncbi:protein phosphatase 2C domain-containing protein [Jiangella sp. DSM 45060]|uniref:protein phosphatase 2C domain-containing protein n=1 Tax=Jiangella sp. DSM 45060 TaxID=1798224 RepID=UPI00087A18D1|nr:protein phosphatase 2C domain-containing protein [Jiangella sp. DSM 45060]SDT70582.1 Protein phosphatase 2C [Jiangella sp. DSM 45060]
MRAQLASIPATADQKNEDFAAVTSNVAVVIDGAGVPPDSESGCRHGVAWYSHMLGASYVGQLADLHRPMTDCLAVAINSVNALHASTCDLGHPGSPSATVTAIRDQGDTIEYLVLADSPLILDLASGLVIICDDREAAIGARYRPAMDATANGSVEHASALRDYVEAMRAHRNRDGGFWVASTEAIAAEHALIGAVRAHDLRAAALLTDGASRTVDRFHLMDWTDLLAQLRSHGPAALLDRVREAEASDPKGHRWPRGKASDDATAIYIQPDRLDQLISSWDGATDSD